MLSEKSRVTCLDLDRCWFLVEMDGGSDRFYMTKIPCCIEIVNHIQVY